MSIWSRLRHGARSFIDRFTRPEQPAREPARETRPEREPERAPETRTPEPEESRLPPGWVLVGLYHEGEKTQKIYATDDTDVTDSEIQHADGIIVHFTQAGADGYKWIHGASGWESIADQINRTIAVVSL